jgi:quinohemoprotein amine dehydrogenase
MTVTAGASSDEFTTATSFTYPRTGKTVTRAGRAVIYTGYQWRGRSTVGDDDASSLREVMMVDRDWRTLSGRWFTGGYDELGVDVQLARVSRDPVVLGLDRPSLKVSTSAQAVRLYGANLPGNLAPGDIDFGRGVTVTRVVSSTPTLVTLDVTVAADAPPGSHDVVVSGVVSRAAVAIYDHVDFIKVSPGWSMARVGGVVFPKMFAQFEAIAYSNGPDNKPDTNDDIALGPVDATWTTEEYMTTYDDDDVKFVGEIDGRNGKFTPALDGPNPARSGNRNNVGDVWVIATVPAPQGAASQTPMRARAHLVVTVPLFMRWDFFTVGSR